MIIYKLMIRNEELFMKKNKFITGTAIFNIINTIMVACSWFIIFGAVFAGSDMTVNIVYAFSWVGLALNIIALVKSNKNNISPVGSILGVIGSALTSFSMLLAFPTLVLLIIATVFQFMQNPKKVVDK